MSSGDDCVKSRAACIDHAEGRRRRLAHVGTVTVAGARRPPNARVARCPTHGRPGLHAAHDVEELKAFFRVRMREANRVHRVRDDVSFSSPARETTLEQLDAWENRWY